MFRFHAHELVQLMDNICGLERDLVAGSPMDASRSSRFVQILDDVRKAATAIKLRTVAPHVARIAQAVQPPGCKPEKCADMLRELHNRVLDELSTASFFFIYPEKAEYLNSASRSWKLVAECFPGAIYDIDEAGMCYATGANSACVFHL